MLYIFTTMTSFAENAALPHGRGTDRTLGKTDFALFDCMGSLHGYYSDVTRVTRLICYGLDKVFTSSFQTIALPDSEIPADHLRIWSHVRSAQAIALHTARQGTLTCDVDEAARSYLKKAGYASWFTHRLGHGETFGCTVPDL
jgi:Xaa-Pro aminopeptidase